jgi:hypothetical protein
MSATELKVDGTVIVLAVNNLFWNNKGAANVVVDSTEDTLWQSATVHCIINIPGSIKILQFLAVTFGTIIASEPSFGITCQ